MKYLIIERKLIQFFVIHVKIGGKRGRAAIPLIHIFSQLQDWSILKINT